MIGWGVATGKLPEALKGGKSGRVDEVDLVDGMLVLFFLKLRGRNSGIASARAGTWVEPSTV